MLILKIHLSILYRDKVSKNKNVCALNKSADKTIVASTKIIITSPSQNNIHIDAGANGNFDSYANGSVTTIFSDLTNKKTRQVKPLLSCPPTIVIDSYEDGQIVRNEECNIDFEDDDIKGTSNHFDSLFDCEITFESSYTKDNDNSRSNSLSNSYDNAPNLLKRSFCDLNLNLSNTEACGDNDLYTSTRDSFLSYDSTNNDITDSEAADYFENGVKTADDSSKNGAKLDHICTEFGGKTVDLEDNNSGKLAHTCENGANSSACGRMNDNMPDLLLTHHCESPTQNTAQNSTKTTYTNEITVTKSIAGGHATSYGGEVVSVASANGKLKYKLYNG